MHQGPAHVPREFLPRLVAPRRTNLGAPQPGPPTDSLKSAGWRACPEPVEGSRFRDLGNHKSGHRSHPRAPRPSFRAFCEKGGNPQNMSAKHRQLQPSSGLASSREPTPPAPLPPLQPALLTAAPTVDVSLRTAVQAAIAPSIKRTPPGAKKRIVNQEASDFSTGISVT